MVTLNQPLTQPSVRLGHSGRSNPNVLICHFLMKMAINVSRLANTGRTNHPKCFYHLSLLLFVVHVDETTICHRMVRACKTAISILLTQKVSSFQKISMIEQVNYPVSFRAFDNWTFPVLIVHTRTLYLRHIYSNDFLNTTLRYVNFTEDSPFHIGNISQLL